MNKWKSILFIIIGFFLLKPLPAQEVIERITLGNTIKYYSKVLGEDRHILVYLPRGYQESEKRYPVLYLLDGGAHFHHGSGLVEFLSNNGLIPQLIVVAIPNTNRNRDFNPTLAEGDTTSGAENFQQFLQDEVIPYINSTYRTYDFKILFGHSQTALFSMFTLVTNPKLFNAYIAASPNLFSYNNLVIKKAKELMTKKSLASKQVYIIQGDEPEYVESIKKFTSLLKRNKAPNFKWKYKRLKRENHATIPHLAIYNGLRFIFYEWQYPSNKADNIDSILKHYSSLTSKFGFIVKPPENLINRLGYKYLNENNYKKAIEVFEINCKIYPNSGNPFDSLGEAYEKLGKLRKAKENYLLAVKMGTKNREQNLPIFKKNLERIKLLLNG